MMRKSSMQKVAGGFALLLLAACSRLCIGQEPLLLSNGSFAQKQFGAAATHLLVGRSMSVEAVHRLTRVYVTNPAVLDTFTSGLHQVLITAKEPGVSSVFIWDESGAYKSYLISSDVNVEALRGSLKQALPHEPVHVESAEGRISLSGTVSTPAVAEAAVKLAALYAKDVSNALVVNSAAVKQVKLQVKIVEVDRTKLDQFGFNFFSAGGNNIAATTTTQYPSAITAANAGSAAASAGGTTNSAGSKTVSVTNALNFLLYSSKLNVGATIQDLETKNILQILAEPTITALSGEKASFLAGGEFPFPVVQSSAGSLASITVQFRPYGVRLDFTPVVNTDGTIQLKVTPEVSALDYTNAVQISGYTIPALSTRRADTDVVLRSGQSFAISGLLDKRTTDSFSRTPGIADTPILGKLFTSKSQNHSTTELVVVVTPEIVSPLTDELPPVVEPVRPMPMLDSKPFDASLPAPKVNKKK